LFNPIYVTFEDTIQCIAVNEASAYSR